MEHVPQDAGWDEWVAEMHRFVRLTFVLSDEREGAVWQYIMGFAAELEYLAVVVLWLADRKPGPLEDYEDHMTLKQAARRVEARQLLDPIAVETLLGVAQLRNGVAHRNALFGVARSERGRGLYKGGHVFTDLDSFKRLAYDVDAAVRAIRKRCDELEPEG